MEEGKIRVGKGEGEGKGKEKQEQAAFLPPCLERPTHTHTHSITRQWHSYSGHHGGLCHPRRAQRQWVLASSPVA